MALKLPRCARCSAATELKTLPSVFGEDGPLKLTLLQLPVFACAKDHNAPVHGDFMIWLIQQVRERETGIPAGKEEGILFKKRRCGECGKELGAKPERRQVFAFELMYEELAPFSLQVEMPLYTCSGCRKEQIRSTKDLHGYVPGAIVGINDNAGFPHSG